MAPDTVRVVVAILMTPSAPSACPAATVRVLVAYTVLGDVAVSVKSISIYQSRSEERSNDTAPDDDVAVTDTEPDVAVTTAPSTTLIDASVDRRTVAVIGLSSGVM